MTMMYIV